MSASRILRHAPLLAFALCGPASAAIIFSDNFSTAGALNGSIPTERPGTETWVSNSTVAGGTLNVAASASSFLAWTPASNNIYSLAVDITSSSALTTTSTFAGIGFFNASIISADVYTNRGPNTAWAFIRTGNPTAGSIGDTSYRPTGGTTTDQNTNFTVTGTNRLELILNTNDTDSITTGVQWSLAFLVNGNQVGTTYTYTDAESTAALANIKNVGFTGSTNANSVASYDNFLLQTIPEPSHFMLAVSGLGLLAIRRRK